MLRIWIQKLGTRRLPSTKDRGGRRGYYGSMKLDPISAAHRRLSVRRRRGIRCSGTHRADMFLSDSRGFCEGDRDE